MKKLLCFLWIFAVMTLSSGVVTAFPKAFNAKGEQIVRNEWLGTSQAIYKDLRNGIANDPQGLANAIADYLIAEEGCDANVRQVVLAELPNIKWGELSEANGDHISMGFRKDGTFATTPALAVQGVIPVGVLTLKNVPMKDGRVMDIKVTLPEKCGNPDAEKTFVQKEIVEKKVVVIEKTPVVVSAYGNQLISGNTALRTSVGISVGGKTTDGRRHGLRLDVGAQQWASVQRKSHTDTWTENFTGTREVVTYVPESHSQELIVNQYLYIHGVGGDPLLREVVPAGDARVTVLTGDSGRCEYEWESFEQANVTFYGQDGSSVVGFVGPTVDVPDGVRRAVSSTSFDTHFSGDAYSLIPTHTYAGNTDYAGNGFNFWSVQIDWTTNKSVVSSEEYTYAKTFTKTTYWNESKNVWMPYIGTGYAFRLSESADVDVSAGVAIPTSDRMYYVRNGENQRINLIPQGSLSLLFYPRSNIAIGPTTFVALPMTSEEGTPILWTAGIKGQLLNMLGLNETVSITVGKVLRNDLIEKSERKDWSVLLGLNLPLFSL